MVDSPVRFDASGRLLAEERQGDNAPPLSISEISMMLKRTVEDRFSHVRLRGEISGFKRAGSGHIYLCLKDEGAVIDGVMWKGGAQRLAFRPEDGLDVIVTGKLTTYPGRSKYQIVIESMELAGEGALMQLFEKMKQRLQAEGLFDPARRKPIPKLPRVIGVVTSPTGAVIRDILHRLNDRFPTHVLVWPVLVQGQGAAEQVAAAVRGFDAIQPGGPVARPDLVIVARGGGSIEDLWAFNEEAVVRAVADCSIPVISAVGHETDTTLCDFAADLRAPTPTAAAEMAVPVRAELLAFVQELGLRSARSSLRTVTRGWERLEAMRRLLPKPDMLIGTQRQRVDDLGDRLRRGLSHQLTDARKELALSSGALRRGLLDRMTERAGQRLGAVRLHPRLIERKLAESRTALTALSRVYGSLDPQLPLLRGFALVRAGDRIVRSADEAVRAGAVTLTFADGAVEAAVGEGSTPPAPRDPAPKPKRARKETGEIGVVQIDMFGSSGN
ncbi:MAG TPA: exodeoxyribonuclease VII large subunit [Sphingobium sp.]|uniref:exodeoxyribonuclease VII large subunit n=1 Tax=Sphingobium sp. TaxID=1912891 RepID=UPI002ED583EF